MAEARAPAPEDETLADVPAPGTAPEATLSAGSPDPDLARDGETIAPAPAPIAPGRALPEVPGYELIRELGRGGMGVVYQARGTRLGRIVALKMILAGDHAGPELALRFQAGAVAKLHHPNIVQIYHIDEHRGCPYFEMEYVDGGTLADRLDGAPRPPRPAARLVEALARAMAEAHRRGIVHRDLKPSNILMTAEGAPKVADFGLAKLLEADSGLTRTDSILGSPSYMAPEQAEGQAHAAGPAADVYALGAILYEQLTGRPPFRGATVLETLQQVKAAEPVPPARLVPGLPRDADTICRKCLEKSPGRRYASADALAEDLRRFLGREPIVARPVPFWERGWKWAQRRPAIAALLLALHLAFAAMLALGALSYARINEALGRANDERADAQDARALEAIARSKSDEAARQAAAERAAALAETYRAGLSEARALRAGHPPGWRDTALANLARLATMPTPRRDPVELRTEAVAALGDFDVAEVARIEGLPSNALGLAFSPDGRTLATAHPKGGVLLWDVARLEPSGALPDPADPPTIYPWPNGQEPWPYVRFRPDGMMARTTWGHRLDFLDPSGGPAPRPPIEGGAAQARGVAFDPNGRWLAVGWSGGRVEIRDPATGAVARPVAADPRALAASPDGRWLAMVGAENSVQLLPMEGDGPAVTLGRHRGLINALAFSPDGATVASASDDHSATLWDVAGRRERLSYRAHTESVTAVGFSPDGAWVATASNDNTARIWDARTGQTLAVLPGAGFIVALAFNPDGVHLATAATNGSASLYRIAGRREQRRLVGHNNGAQCLAFDPRLPRLATGADDHDVILWDPATGRPTLRWKAHPGAYTTAVAFSPDGTLLATGTGGWTDVTPIEKARLWDARTGAFLRVLEGHVTGVHALAFDPAGRRLASGDESGVVIVREVATGRVLRREVVGPSWVWSLAFLDGGRRLVTEASNGPIVLLDLEGTGPTRRVGMPGGLRRFVHDPSKNRLIAALNDGSLATVALADLTAGPRLAKAHDGPVESLALSPDGTLLATGGMDRRVILRDAATFAPLLEFPAWTGLVKDLAFDASGRYLAYLGADADVACWDLGQVRDELASAGLAWDRPAPPVASAADLAAEAGRPAAKVRVIRPGGLDLAEVERARALLVSGNRAEAAGRPAEAIGDFRAAADRLRPLARRHPGDRRLSCPLGHSLTGLGGALRDSGRPAEAPAAFAEARAAFRTMAQPEPGDLYDLARSCAQLGALGDRESPPTAPDGREALAVEAVEAMRRCLAANPALGARIDRDRDLDPLRGRADFRALVMDCGFPADPFAPLPAEPAPAPTIAAPAPAAPAMVGGIGVTALTDPAGGVVAALAPGGPAERDGRIKPGDVILGVDEPIPFAGKPMAEIGSRLRGEPGTAVRVVVRPRGTDRREVYELTRALVPIPPPPTEAEALDLLLAARPDDAGARRKRGNLLARRGRWEPARADFRKLLELEPGDSDAWLNLATIDLQLGDVEDYRRLSRAMLDRFGATEDIFLADHTAKSGSLRPAPPEDRARLAALAELALTRGADSPFVPWFRLARGMAAYRDGDFALAAATLGKVATPNPNFCQGAAESYLAMAEHRLGHAEAARAALDRARQILQATAPPANDLGVGWHDWLIAQLALREAEALVRPDAAPDRAGP